MFAWSLMNEMFESLSVVLPVGLCPYTSSVPPGWFRFVVRVGHLPSSLRRTPSADLTLEGCLYLGSGSEQLFPIPAHEMHLAEERFDRETKVGPFAE